MAASSTGWANTLMEEAVYDEATGQLLTGTLMDYALPHPEDVPSSGQNPRHPLAPTTSWA